MTIYPTTKGSIALTTGVEFSVARGAVFSSGSLLSTTGPVHVWLDLGAFVVGDTLELRLYRSINGGPPTPLDGGTPDRPQVYSWPVGIVGVGWDVTVKLTSATGRTLVYEVIQNTGNVNVDTLSTDAIDANALAAAGVTKIQTGLGTSAAQTTLQASATDIQGRLPAALIGGRMSSDVEAWLNTVPATPTVAGVPKVEISSVIAGAVTTIQAGLSTATALAAVATSIASLATSAALALVQTDTTSLLARLTATRAGLLDFLDAFISSRASAVALAVVQSDTDDIQARLPSALVSGRMASDVGTWLGTAVGATAPGVPNVADQQVRTSLAAVAGDVATIGSLTTGTAAAVISLQSDVDDVQTRLPAALDGAGNIKAGVQSIVIGALASISAGLLASTIENGINLAGTLRTILRREVGKLTGVSAGAYIYRDLADTKDAITGTVTADGRTVTAIDPT